MKKLLAIFLIFVLVCATMVACDELPALGGGGEGGTENGGGNTENGGGNTENGGGNTENGGGNTENGGGNTTPTVPDPDNMQNPLPEVGTGVRVTVTEQEWAAMIAGEYADNYTQYTTVENSSVTGNGIRYLATTAEGKVLFLDMVNENGVAHGKGAFPVEGGIAFCEYDPTTDKWTGRLDAAYSLAHPVKGMPFALSEFTFDEASGSYYMEMEGAEGILTAEQIAAGLGRLVLKFADGKCVYMAMPMSGMDEASGGNKYVFTGTRVAQFGNYGTTEVPIPAADKIEVVGDGTSNVHPDFGGGGGIVEDEEHPESDMGGNKPGYEAGGNNGGKEEEEVPPENLEKLFVDVTSKTFHREGCSHLADGKYYRPMTGTVDKFVASGMNPCPDCIEEE